MIEYSTTTEKPGRHESVEISVASEYRALFTAKQTFRHTVIFHVLNSLPGALFGVG